MLQEALDYWLLAGRLAITRSANAEAIAHLGKGLDLILQLPVSDLRDRKELDFYLVMGPALMATRGFASSEVENAYVKGHQLCIKIGTKEQLFTATWGLWVYRQQRGQMEQARQLTADLLTQAADKQDKATRLQAYHAAWTTDYRLADFSTCCEYAEQGIELYKAQEHKALAFKFGGHDAGICGLQHAAMSRWVLGFPDQAVAHRRNLLILADQLEQPFSKALGLSFAAMLSQLLHQVDMVKKLVDSIEGVCSQWGVAPQYWNSSRVLLGWTMISSGQVDQGFEVMHQGLENHRAGPARAHEPYLLALSIELCINHDMLDQARELLSVAFEQIEHTGEISWQAELYRLNGELQMTSGNQFSQQAEQAFKQAIHIARKQKAKSFELRATTSLASLLLEQGDSGKAFNLLSPLYRSFSEGLNSSDLIKASELLQRLA